MEQKTAWKLTENLREFADFVDDHHDLLPEEISIRPNSYVYNWTVNANNDQSIPDIITKAMRAGLQNSGKVKKNYASDTFTLTFTFGELNYKILCDREEVCERIVTGTQEVTESVAVKWEDQTRTKETVTWKCHPLLAVVEGGDNE